MNTRRYFPGLVVKAAVLVLLAEAAVMSLLHFLDFQSPLAEAAVDSLLLALIVTPFFVRWSFRIAGLLAESEEKFRTLSEKSMVGIFMVQDGVFRYVNPKLCEISGYNAEELVGKKGPMDMVPPGEHGMVGASMARLLSGELSSDRREFTGLKKGGAPQDVEVYVSAVSYAGRPALLGTLMDITERKRAEGAIKEAEARTRLILNSSGDGIIGVDRTGRVLFANRSAREMLGWSQE